MKVSHQFSKNLTSLVHEQYFPGDKLNRVLTLRVQLERITEWHSPVEIVANKLSHAIQETFARLEQIVGISYTWESDEAVWEEVKSRFSWRIAVDERPNGNNEYPYGIPLPCMLIVTLLGWHHGEFKRYVQLGLTGESKSRNSPWGRWGVETAYLEALLSLWTYDFQRANKLEQVDDDLSEEQRLLCTEDFLFVIGDAKDYGHNTKQRNDEHGRSHERILINIEQNSSTPKSRIQGYVCSSQHTGDQHSEIQRFYHPRHIVGRHCSKPKGKQFIAYNYGFLSGGRYETPRDN